MCNHFLLAILIAFALILTMGCTVTQSIPSSKVLTETPIPPTTLSPAVTTTKTPISSTARSTATAMLSPVGTPLSLGIEPVAHNGDWTPYIKEFGGVEMALVPVGCFEMGSTDEQLDGAMQLCEKLRGAGNCDRSWYQDEQPVKMQCFDEPFWIDVYEVTNVQYGSSGEWSDDELPREQVNWADAFAHCKSRGARLPTEAEWEYAARGPDGLVFPWGDGFEMALVNSCDRNCEFNSIGTLADDGYATSAPVGSYADGASWVGAMDMSGNVWEWTSSLYLDFPYSITDGRDSENNADGSGKRVLRGGSWYHSGSDLLRSAARYGVSPEFKDYVLGFRCAISSAKLPIPPVATVLPPTNKPFPTPTATPAKPPTPTSLQTHIPTIEPLRLQATLVDENSPGNGPVYSLVFSPDGRWIAAAGYRRASLWDTDSYQKRSDLEGINGFVWGIDWSPDGKMIATASDDGFVRLFHSDSGERIEEFRVPSAFCVDWSPDSTLLAAGTEKGNIYVWDIPNSEERFQQAADGFIVAIDWSPDGQMLATGELSGKIEVWDARSGKILKSFDDYTDKRSDTNGVAWSPDGRLLATAHQDGIIRIWDIELGALTRTLSKHSGWARGVAWSPAGNMIASTGSDRILRLWDVATGQMRMEVKEHTLPVWSVAWSPDGKHLATGEGIYEDGSNFSAILIWELP